MMKKRMWRSLSIFILVVLPLLAAACGGSPGQGNNPNQQGQGSVPNSGGSSSQSGSAASGSGVTIRYALWDSMQQPAYEQCAAAFHKQNPNISVKIEQAGWNDYWNNIQTGFVSGNAPDVFTDHVSKYPEFALKNQLVDLQPLVDKDKVDTSIYIKGLADVWVRNGKRYGLPKDWDTIAVVYNTDMLKKAGVDPSVMNNWDWNPKDGGSFEKTIAQLTLDKNGNNGLSPNFDKNHVVQYGFIQQGGGGAYGQTQWSMFAVSDGFKFNDGPWSTHYYYDSPQLAETMDWYAGLVKKGFAPKEADVSSLGPEQLLISKKGAMTTDGSWQINNFVSNAKFKVGFGLLPKGPNGRKSMFNGLADSIWVGSKHQQEAWQWVKFLASPACENIVGDSGVVFPAIQSGVDKSLAAHKAKGVDVTAFTQEALDPNGTFLFPITDHASEISDIMTPVMESIMLGQTQAGPTLKQANAKVNALFK